MKFVFYPLLCALFVFVSCDDDEGIAPSLAADKESIDFGSVEAGESASESVSLTGVGVGEINLSVSGDGFSVSPSTIEDGSGNHTISVTFAPTEGLSGSFQGTLSAVSGAFTIDIPLTAQSLDPSFSVDQTTVSFGNVISGNTITATLNFSSSDISNPATISVTGDGFSVDQTELANASGPVMVSFTANDVAGARAGRVTATTGDLKININLSAIVVIPEIEVSTDSIGFGNVVAQVQVSEMVTITGINLTNSVSLSFTGDMGFSADVSEITDGNGENTISVSYEGGASEIEGLKEAVLTIASGDQVSLSIPVTANLIPYIFTANKSTIDFGDVLAGTTATESVVFSGQNLSEAISISVTDGFIADVTSIADGNGDSEVMVSFNPSSDAAPGPVTGSLMATVEDTVITIDLLANVSAILPVYLNDFEFALDQNAELSAADFEAVDSLGTGVSATYDLVFFNPSASTVNIRTQRNHGRCDDGTAGDLTNGVDCGSGFQIVGGDSDDMTANTSITINLTGLTAAASYELTYYVRPNGSSERAMNVIVTGDPNSDTLDNYDGGDNDIYVERTRQGVADGSGNLSITFEYASASTSRSISLDDFSVKPL